VRLLFDEQLSEELVSLLAFLFPDSLHVRLLEAGGVADPVIWQLARDHGCLLVTKDEDFHRLSVLRGAPPKVCGFEWATAQHGDRAGAAEPGGRSPRVRGPWRGDFPGAGIKRAEIDGPTPTADGAWRDHVSPRLKRHVFRVVVT
jgi:hypothetical protein